MYPWACTTTNFKAQRLSDHCPWLVGCPSNLYQKSPFTSAFNSQINANTVLWTLLILEMGKDHERDLSVIQHLNMPVQAHDHDLSSEVAIENLRQQLRKPVSQKIIEVAPTIDVNVDNCSTEVTWSTFKINFKVSVDLTEHGGISRLNFASRCRSPVVENQGSSSSRAAACLFTKPSPSSERAYATCSYVVSVN